MRSYKLVEAGLTEDEIPVFKFETELHDGADFDGKFHIQFAAVQQDGEKRFAVNSPRGLLAVFGENDSRRLARALDEAGEYILCANYNNREWEEPGAIGTVLMGRDIGDDVDHRERYDLPPEEQEAVRQIAETLDPLEGA